MYCRRAMAASTGRFALKNEFSNSYTVLIKIKISTYQWFNSY